MQPLECRHYHIKLDSKPENLAVVRNFFKDIAAKHDISESDAYDILVSVGEATTNAIEHGNGTPVEILCEITHDTLHATIKSKGTFARKAPLVEEDNFRGRGILLMLALMDQVSIDDVQSSVTVVMSKKFKRAS